MAYGTVNVDSVVNSDGTITGGLYGFKNRIINGAMVIDQRNAGASVNNIASSMFTLDRYLNYGSVAAKYSIQQNAGGVTPPVGFKNYYGLTSLSAFTPTAAQLNYCAQYIEGYNIADLGWGAANAAPVTISFWVRSSLTGTFSGCVSNAVDRSYPFTYTVSAANTWEYKTVTIAGDTSGTWNSTNTAGIVLRFNLGSGSDWLGTAGAWAAGNLLGASTGATSLVGTSGATLYFTGLQLEKGSTATSFDFRSIGTELALCQRYYQVTTKASALCYDSAGLQWTSQMKVSMRTAPTVTFASGGIANNIRRTSTGTAISASSPIIYDIDQNGSQFFYAASGWSPALVAGQSYDFGNTFSAEI